MISQPTEAPQADSSKAKLSGTSSAESLAASSTAGRSEVRQPTEPAVEFRVARPGMPLRRLRLQGARYTFGSGPEASIRLDDSTLQGIHAVLTRDGGHLTLRSPATPIAVNGNPRSSTRLVAGDRFQLGQFAFELVASGPPAAATPPEPASANEAPPARAATTRPVRRRLSFAAPSPPPAAPSPPSAALPAAPSAALPAAPSAALPEEIPVEGQAAVHRAILANERRWQERNKRQLSRHRRRQAEQRKQIETLLAAQAEAERRAGDSEQAVLEVRQQMAELAEQVAALRQTAGPELEQRLEEHNSAAAVATQKHDALLDSLRERLDAVQELVDGVQRESSELREQTVSVREDQREVLSNAELLEKMILRLSESRDMDRAGQSLELNEIRENFRQLSLKLSHTSGQLNETQENSQSLTAEVSELRSSLLEMQSDTQRFATIEQIDAVEDQLRLAGARLSELSADYDSQAQQLRQECELLKQRLEDFEQAAAEKFAALERAELERAELERAGFERQPAAKFEHEHEHEHELSQEHEHEHEHEHELSQEQEQEQELSQGQHGEGAFAESLPDAEGEAEAAPPVWSFVAPEPAVDAEEADEAFGATALWAPPRDAAEVDAESEVTAEGESRGASAWEQLSSGPSLDGQTMAWTAPANRDFDAESDPSVDDEAASLDEPAAAAGPRSAAEVLASMGMAYGDDEEEEVDEARSAVGQSAEHGERIAEGAAEPVSERDLSDTDPASALDPPDEDSIEAYMNRLLQRVQGGSSSARTTAASAAAEVTAVAATTHMVEPSGHRAAGGGESTPATTHGAAPESVPAATASSVPGSASGGEPTSYLPRSQAPERTSNLAAMRELANDSARTAIAHSVRKRMVHQQLTKFALAGLAVLGGGAIMFASEFSMDHWLLAACCCFCLAIFFVIEGLQIRRNLQSSIAAPEPVVLKPSGSETEPSEEPTALAAGAARAEESPEERG